MDSRDAGGCEDPIDRPQDSQPIWCGESVLSARALRRAAGEVVGARKGTNVGANNPNYGKFGADHPSFGHVMSEEAKAKLSEMRKGSGNPNFGRTASDETRAKMSAVRKGRPMPSSRRSAHTRYHTNKGVYKDTCQHCRDDQSTPPRPLD